MRRPPIAQNSLWSSCHATGCYIVHVVGRGEHVAWMPPKRHMCMQVHVDRYTLTHVFLSQLPKYFSFICLMERILNVVISPLGFLYSKNFCLSPWESLLLLLWVNSVCLEVDITILNLDLGLGSPPFLGIECARNIQSFNLSVLLISLLWCGSLSVYHRQLVCDLSPLIRMPYVLTVHHSLLTVLHTFLYLILTSIMWGCSIDPHFREGKAEIQKG